MGWPLRDQHGGGSEAAAIAAAGGMLVVPPDADPTAIRQAVDQGARALELHRGDLSMLAGTPLGFLHVVSVTANAGGLRDLPHLRSLSMDAWRGDVDLAALPSLEWLHVAEVEAGQFASLAVPHPTLRHVRIGQYRGEDLALLAGMPGLEYLSLWQAGQLASLRGIPAELEVLELARCPALTTLDGIEGAPGLQAVVLDTCNKVDDLAPLADLADLRLVQLDMRKPPSLEPFVGHSTLEFVWIVGGSRPAGEVEALQPSPALRMVNVRRATWMRTPQGWEHFPNVYAMTEEQLAARDRVLDDLNRRKTR